MAATIRWSNKIRRHCNGKGWSSKWHMAQGACFRCGPDHTEEVKRTWFGVTLEWEGRTFKAVVRSYDAQAACEDAADLQLVYLEADQLSRDERGFALSDDPARNILCRWA